MLRRFVEVFLSIPAPLAVAAVFLVTAGRDSVLPWPGAPGRARRDPGRSARLAGAGPARCRAARGSDWADRRRLDRILPRPALWPPRFFKGRRRKRWAKARAWLRRRGAFAVFPGRFTAFFRSIVPAAAGAARLPYSRFLPWNIAAGVLWGVGSALLGYFAGRNYETLARRAGLLSLALCVLVLAAALVSLFRRRTRSLHARERRSRRTHASRSEA